MMPESLTTVQLAERIVLCQLLAERHTKGVFVPECKMGAAGSRMLDGWALLPTWSPLTSIGYEIKVSRSDWLRDQKFEDYRAVCHLFFVVAPRGVVQRGELPDGVGLLEPIGQGTGCRLVQRVKAVLQTPDAVKLVRLMAHVLMWRKDLSGGSSLTRAERADFWRKWVDERQEFRAIALNVRGRMRTMLKDTLDAQQKAEAHAKQLDETRIAMEELGVRPGWDRWSTKRRIEAELRKGATETIASLDAAIQQIASLRDRVAAIDAQAVGA